jgi:uncharacterized protein (TIGR03066 family)
MPTLRSFVLCAVVLSSSALLSADEPKKQDRSGSESSSKEKEKDKKPDYAKLLVGKWVRTDGQYAGTLVVYDANGTHTTTSVTKINGKPIVMSGTWKLDGEKIAQTLGQGRNLTDTSVTVVALTETTFRFKNKAGQEATYERVVEEGEQGTGEKKDKK